ncbi:MAG: carbohydrate ABC transporter permease [Christensenellales bacterium]|jgi:putative aldouronate transport system permease protein|nr:carbohydrate ABC transporter permease [Candidatus Fimadaptatus sp.]
MVSTKKNSRNHRDGEPHALKSRGDIIFETVVVIILAILTLIILYPLYFVVIASFSDAKLVVAGEVWWYPKGVTLENYMQCFTNGDLMLGYRNAFIILILGTATNLFLTILCAYPLSRHDLWGRNGIMIYCTIPMFFGGGLIPTYLMVTQTLGLKNSWWAVILVAGIATYNMIIMRTFFMTSIPFELQEAAQIDGCTPIGILLRIILPLSIPVICVIGLYYGVNHWNSYFSALVYLPDKNKWPLQLFLRQILVNNDISAVDGGASSDEMARRAMRAETIKYSIVILASIPMLIIYPFVQRYFVKGVMIGSVKG